MPEQSGTPAVELRVHGVSGTPPEDLLDRPIVDQRAGDAIAGFYSPRLASERRDAAPNVFVDARPDAPEMVGYSWGGLTSGSPSRALWLLLLPFTLANVAPRARPAGAARDSRRVAWVWYSTRVLALVLTCLYMVTGIGIGEDLIGWQCAGRTSCAKANPHWVFHDLSIENRLSAEHMLVLGAILPVLVLLLMWAVSSRTANRYERTVADLKSYDVHVDVQKASDTNDVELPLSSELMWRNAEQVRRLRAVHMQVGFAAVLWSLVGAAEGPRVHWYDVRGHWWMLVPLAVLAYALVALAMPSFTGHGESTRWRRASGAVWVALAVAGGVQVGGLLVAHTWISDAFVRAGDRAPQHGLPYYGGTVAAVCIAAVVALFFVLVTVLISLGAGLGGGAAGDHKKLRPALGGLATVAFAALGVFLAAGFTAGAYTFGAAFLNTGSLKPGFPQVAKVFSEFPSSPLVLFTAGIAYAVSVVLLAAVLLVVAIVVGLLAWKWPFHASAADRDYPGRADSKDAQIKSRRMQIRRAMFFGSIVDKAPWFVGWLVGSGMVILVWFTVVLLQADGNRPKHAIGSISKGWLSASSLAGMGSYFAVLTLAGLVSLGAIAFRVPKSRRVVGILWDVASFWPRACHPLAAPCYAERTVPDLITYVSAQCAEGADAQVVLTAHSQGTVITAATIRQLDTFDNKPGVDAHRRVVPRLSFVSCGCVLRRLYGRYFPVYFGPAELNELQTLLTPEGAKLPRWRNLWRYTDYLGGQVTAGPPQLIPPKSPPDRPRGTLAASAPVVGPADWEWHSPDPPYFDRQPGETTYSRPHRHSDFWSDESGYLQLAVCEVLTAAPKRPRPKPAGGGAGGN